MNIFAVLAGVVLLAGCGGSDPVLLDDQEQGTSTVFNPDGPVINACAAPYFQELVGDYDGQVSYTAPDGRDAEPVACVWEKQLSVLLRQGESGNSCTVGFDLQSQIVTGTSTCAELATSGDMTDGLNYLNNDDYSAWNSPQWPIELSAGTTTFLAEGSVLPIGKTFNNGAWQYLFDGLGNITFTSAVDSAVTGWDGVLVKAP